MSQQNFPNKPLKVNTDTSHELLKTDESPFVKNLQIMVGKNADKDGAEGGNVGMGTPINATVPLSVKGIAAAGTNVCIGSKECKETHETYYALWNSLNNHGIYKINGSNLTAQVVKIDPNFNFSLDPAHALPGHRWVITCIYDADDVNKRFIKEKIITFTDGLNWQRWILSMASIATQGFNASNPYWALKGPHFDGAEFIELAVRPSPYAPKITPVPATIADQGKTNKLLKQSVQFATVNLNTDGRPSVLSQHSVPYHGLQSDFDVNNYTTPRELDLEIYAGSALVEKILVLHRLGNGDWKLYDTISRYSTCGVNDPKTIGDAYWNRTEPFKEYSYDPVKNTIKYRYAGDRESGIYDADHAKMVQTGLSIKSVAIAAAGDAIVLGHNLIGYPNLSCSTLDKIEIGFQEQKNTGRCEVKMQTIKVYALMAKGDVFSTQFVFQESGAENAKCFFGGAFIQPFITEIDKVNTVDYFGLNLGDNKGLICYLAGTDYYASGKQMLVTAAGKSDFGVINTGNIEQLNTVFETMRTGKGFFVQEFTFTVPSGKYIARLARHTADLSKNYQETSTYVKGMFSRTNMIDQTVDTSVVKAHEVLIDVTAGDYDAWTGRKEDKAIFYVFTPESRFVRYRMIEGYVWEDSQYKVPVENMLYSANHGGYEYSGSFTDHNGFYFSQSTGGAANDSLVEFFGRINCAGRSSSALFDTGGGGGKGYFPDRNIAVKDSNGGIFGEHNHIKIAGRLVDHLTGVGMSGIGLTLEGTRTYFTGSDGEYEVIVHNHYDNEGRTGFIYINSGSKGIFVTAQCQQLAPIPYNELSFSCSLGVVRTTRVGDILLKALLIKPSRHLKENGRYGFGIVGWDAAMRGTYQNRIKYQDIPSFLERNSFDLPQLIWSLKGSLNLPKDIKWLSFFRTDNLNNKKFIQWVGDKIEFLDKDNEPTTGSGAVRAKITIQSLLDYNVDNNFSTTAGYQFVQGDRVRIYDDGNETLMDPLTNNGYLDYEVLGTNFSDTILEAIAPATQPDGRSFIINYDSRLRKIAGKTGFWIEIASPQGESEGETYTEIPGMYPVINGEISGSTGGVLETFDTYYYPRNIAIPNVTGKRFNHPFASSSVTDFWGAGFTSNGRVSVRDEKAESRWYRDDIIKSDELVNEGRVNGQGSFRASNRKQFKGSENGGIVAMYAERTMIFFICQNDWFVTNYNMEMVKVNQYGSLVATTDKITGSPNPKVGVNFGCLFEDTSTIDFSEGIGMWADSVNSAVILTNFQSAYDISSPENKSYFLNKFQAVNEFNSKLPAGRKFLDAFIKTGIIDPVTNAYHLTFRPRRGLSQDVTTYVNNEREVFYNLQETFAFYIEQKAWRFISPTPECYGRLRGSLSGKELISFVNGEPHLHNVNSGKFNEFYGIECDQVFEIVVNGERGTDKLFQGFAIEGGAIGYFCDKIITHNKRTFSYVPMGYFVKRANVYKASIKCDMSTTPSFEHPVNSMLIDGAGISGLWMLVRFVRDPKLRTGYNELDNIWTRFICREKPKS